MLLRTTQCFHACRRCYSAEEGRDAFKTLKNQQIAYKCAHLYSEWAAMELQEGNEARAVKQLKVGIREEAQPIRWPCGGALGGNGLLLPCHVQCSAHGGGEGYAVTQGPDVNRQCLYLAVTLSLA